MVKQRIEIPMYRYTLYLIKLSFEDYKGEKPTTSKMGMRNSPIYLEDMVCDDIDENIKDECLNGAITCHCGDSRKMVVLFYPMKDEDITTEVYEHEKRHVEDYILEHLDINDMEAAAYLAGYLGKIFWKFRNK